MPSRKVILATGETYHLFNRTVGNEVIFSTKRHLKRILNIIDYYRFPQSLRYSRFKTLPKSLKQQYWDKQSKQPQLVEIFAYSIMPNHFHFLLKQLQENGIRIFASNIQNSYARFFNIKGGRHGTLFTNPFKSKRAEDEKQFIHLSRYIHLNHLKAFLMELEELINSPWSSFSSYMDKAMNRFISTELILNHFGSKELYMKFVLDQIDYQRKLDHIKHLTLD